MSSDTTCREMYNSGTTFNNKQENQQVLDAVREAQIALERAERVSAIGLEERRAKEEKSGLSSVNREPGCLSSEGFRLVHSKDSSLK